MKSKNPLLLSLPLLVPMLLLVACGTSTTRVTTAPVSATTPARVTTTGTTANAVPNPFADAVRASPNSFPEAAETIAVDVEGESWVLPAAVCLRAEGDSDIVLTEAQRQVAIVHNLVAPMISGWPSTTWNPSRTEEAQAKLEQILRIAGVTAMTLAGLVGEQAALEQAWVDYEQSFASPSEGWSGPNHISGRIPEWKAEAEALTEAIAAQCSAE